MQATAESIRRVSTLVYERRYGVKPDKAPPEGFPQAGMRPCQKCGAACWGDICRTCYQRTKGEFRREKKTLPLCAESGCTVRLSSQLAKRCRKHAAQRRQSNMPEGVHIYVNNHVATHVKAYACIPSRRSHSFLEQMDGAKCTCGAVVVATFAEAVSA